MNDEKLTQLTKELDSEEDYEEQLKKMNEYLMDEDLSEELENGDIFTSKSFYLDTSLVRIRMKERNLTLMQLHKQVGVAYRTVIRWLSGEEFPRDENLLRLAAALEMEPYEFIVKISYSKHDPVEDILRFVHRRIEKVVTEILDDANIDKDKKFDALVKYHSELIKAKKR